MQKKTPDTLTLTSKDRHIVSQIDYIIGAKGCNFANALKSDKLNGRRSQHKN